MFTGLYVATLTPLDAGNRIDFGVVRAHIDFLAEGGAVGVCPVGTTGEFLYLSVGEKVRLIEETVSATGGRMKVIAGVWALMMREIALLARAAQAAGADAVFLPPPIYYPADDEVIFRHYVYVREASDLPVFAYNIPAYAANSISLECLERLAGDGVVVGVKDSSGNAERMQALIERFGSRLSIMAASDSFAVEARRSGAHGFISALANIWPKSFARLWAGEDALQPAIDAIRAAVKQAGGIPALKYLMSRRGFAFGTSRLPFTDLSDEQRAALERAYRVAVDRGLE
ncbi:MAG TPA: dihydrodipicolinate synthase family protein [Chthonomonadales bacterium]|nr:dihydrodipicolinate synthase family protein [Chthonomonadales bacterium]